MWADGDTSCSQPYLFPVYKKFEWLDSNVVLTLQETLKLAKQSAGAGVVLHGDIKSWFFFFAEKKKSFMTYIL